MISLLPSANENQLMLNLIDESMRLFGIDITLYDVKSINMYLDDQVLQEGHPYKMLLQDYIDSRILANLKWCDTDVDGESIVAFMPIQYNNVKFKLIEHMVIHLENGDTYQIKEINKSYLVGLWYIVKLLAYMPETNRARPELQMKTNFLKTDVEELE